MEMRVRDVELVNMNPEPDFSPAPSILGSLLPFPLTSLFSYTLQEMRYASDKHTFSANNPKKNTRLGFNCLIDSTLTINR